MANYETQVRACMMEMFRRVGLAMETYEEVAKWAEDHGDHWFMCRTWTEEQEDDFRKWMKDYLKKSTRWSVRTIENEIRYFILMWGWKTEG